MGQEINLLTNYPQSKRDLSKRLLQKTEADRNLARQFGQAFFDGDRSHGYGGFSYHERFWGPVVPTFQDFYGLDARSTILDVGCAKGFMLYDFQRLIPGISIQGIDISEYAIANSMTEVRPYVQVGNAVELPYPDNCFDLVISITTLHNLEREDLKKALSEIMRVSKQHAFITLDAYRNNEEKERMEAWNLTAQTMMHTEEWKRFFDESNYTGDYYWFIP